MPPEILSLAQSELQQLQEQGLVQPVNATDAEWACQAFYVNKRFEQC